MTSLVVMMITRIIFSLIFQYEVQPRQESPEDGGNVTSTTETSENSDVETELFIGPPEKRFKRIMEK